MQRDLEQAGADGHQPLPARRRLCVDRLGEHHHRGDRAETVRGKDDFLGRRLIDAAAYVGRQQREAAAGAGARPARQVPREGPVVHDQQEMQPS